MTMWKDILPEYEPGNDSWKKLEDSLHLDEQLRRTLPELPAYEPQENSWDGIMIKLLPRVSRLSRYSGIAAAVLILIVAGTFFLLKRNEIHEDRISGKELLQSSPHLNEEEHSEGPYIFTSPVDSPGKDSGSNSSGNNSSLSSLEPSDGLDPSIGHADLSNRTPSATGIAFNSTGIASGTAAKPREKEKGERINKGGRVNTGKKAAESGEVKRDRDGFLPEKPSETQEIALLPPTAEKPPPGEAGNPIPGESSNTAKLAAAPSLSQKVDKGRHRVIRIDWETPEGSKQILVRLPREAPDERESNNDNYPIKIKL